MALQQLLNEVQDTDFEELLFWGRISGAKADYYIAMGVTFKHQFEFPTKTFYYASSNDFIFKKFRDINTQHKDEYDKLTTAFTGDPALVIIKDERERSAEEQAAEAAKVQAEEEKRDELADTPEEDPNANYVYRNLIEEDRLLYTVMAIESDCQICPHGAFRMTEVHETERNVAFRGLPRQYAFSINYYSHFRNVQSDEKKELLETPDAVYAANFLDEVAYDVPMGCWSIQPDVTNEIAIIRNNMWQGFTAYHRQGTNEFGGVYVGDGFKNTDLCFQL